MTTDEFRPPHSVMAGIDFRESPLGDPAYIHVLPQMTGDNRSRPQFHRA